MYILNGLWLGIGWVLYAFVLFFAFGFNGILMFSDTHTLSSEKTEVRRHTGGSTQERDRSVCTPHQQTGGLLHGHC